MKKSIRPVLLATTAFALALAVAAPAAHAAAPSRLDALEQQLLDLQKEVKDLQAAKAKAEKEAQEAKAQAAAAPVAAVPVAGQPVAVAAAATSSTTEPKSVGDKLQASIQQSTGVKVSLGGFMDATMLVRSKNQGTDAGTNWNTSIPFHNLTNSRQSEFRATARNTRLNMTASANPDADTTLTGFVEADFLGTNVNSSPVQSNNYSPRLRQAWASYEDSSLGLHFLAGQAYSLASQNTVGIIAKKENMPGVLDAGLVPGTVWTRSTQFRIVKDFADKKVWAGLSVEAPSTNYVNASSTSIATTYGANASTATNLSGGTVTSNDIAPDVVGKLAFDPGFGHYEIFGIGRTFHDRFRGENNTAFAGSGGASVLFKTLSGKLDITANALAGQAVGRYAAGQLPDLVFTPSGDIKPTTGYAALFGLVGHPTPTWDLFAYAGVEQIMRENYGSQGTTTGIGYGNTTTNTTACYGAETTTACSAQTQRIWQVTGGVWKAFYKGNFGKFQAGLQDSITRRDAFSGSTGLAPHAYENVSLVSVRFTPAF